MSSRAQVEMRPASASSTARGAFVRGLAVVAALIAGAILVLLRDSILPARFSYDAKGIQAIGQGTLHVVDPAFQSVAETYKLLGLINDPTAAGLLGYLGAFGVLAIAGRRLLRPQAPLSAMILFFAAVLLSAVYLGTYSKDVFVLPVTLVAVLPGGRWRWPVLTAIGIVLYAFVFRTYWFVVLGVWLSLQAVLARRPRVLWVLAVMLLGSALLAAVIGLALHESADFFRSSINDGRVDSADASSAIDPIVPGGTVLTGIVNTPLILLSLFVPLPLVLKGGLYFVVLTAVFAVFWVRTGVGVQRSIRAGADLPDRSRIALLLAFVVVQALFEPDYGSALRHLTPLLPIAVMVWAVPRTDRLVSVSDRRVRGPLDAPDSAGRRRSDGVESARS